MQLDNLLTFVELGFRHILPLGLDHILFVVAIYLTAASWRALLALVTTFTLAHSVTLGLASAGVLNLPAEFVEPVIALSIAVVGLEALFLRAGLLARLPVIFLFGLFHGLGFASQMRGFTEGVDFLTALLGFNIGVELGQLAVLGVFGAAALVIAAGLKALGREGMYKWVVVRPVAVVIVAIGLFWFVERLGVLPEGFIRGPAPQAAPI